MFPIKAILHSPATNGSIKSIPAILGNGKYNQSRSLCRKSKLDLPKNYLTYRWPYEKLPWNFLTMWLDPFTKQKFNENTKLIVVDGNIAAGKNAVAKKVAEDFGLLYMAPNLNLDDLYINDFGFDYRALNPLLPERLRICDFDMWHENPTRLSVVHLQHFIFKLRIHQYIKALRHMFNTGQGVVLVRSALSDRVFVEAMHNLGWLPKGYLRGDGVRFYDWKMRYNFLRNYIFSAVPKPHLTIYVDTPVDTCLERIKNDPNPNVRDSKALSREFLEEIESVYKNLALPKSDYNGQLITISGAEDFIEDDFVDLADEIEQLNYELDHNDTRFSDWDDTFPFYRPIRREVTSSHANKYLHPLGSTAFYDIAGLGDCVTHADLVLRESLYEQHVGELGYNHTFLAARKIHGLFKSVFGFESLEDRLQRALKSDFA